MRKLPNNSGVTLVEALIGLIIFVAIALPLIRFASGSENSAKVKDLKIACALLRGECAVMYKNQRMPEAQRLDTIDNRIYEINTVVRKESVVADTTANSITAAHVGDSAKTRDSLPLAVMADSLKPVSGIVNWSMTVSKAGKMITGVHGLLYVPPKALQVQN